MHALDDFTSFLLASSPIHVSNAIMSDIFTLMEQTKMAAPPGRNESQMDLDFFSLLLDEDNIVSRLLAPFMHLQYLELAYVAPSSYLVFLQRMESLENLSLKFDPLTMPPYIATASASSLLICAGVGSNF